MLVLRVDQFKNIKTNMMVCIGGVKIYYVFYTMRRNSGEDCFYVFSVRVYHTNPITIFDVLNNHIKHQSGFTSTGFSENINMLTPVFALYSKKLILVPIGSKSKISNLFICRYFWQFHIVTILQ